MPAGLLGGVLLEQRGFLGGGEHAVQPAQHRERQDHAAVLALLEVAAQKVGHGPDEGRECLLVHGEVIGRQSLSEMKTWPLALRAISPFASRWSAKGPLINSHTRSPMSTGNS
jgi:hypothetical protein